MPEPCHTELDFSIQLFDPLFAVEKMVEEQSTGRVHDRRGRSSFWASWWTLAKYPCV